MNEKKPETKYMKVGEVADLLGKSMPTIRAWCKAGYMVYYQDPGETGEFHIDRKSVREFRRKLLAGKI